MSHSEQHGFNHFNRLWDEWIQDVTLTQEESETIRASILEEQGTKEKVRLNQHLTRTNRIVSFCNRASKPYSKRYQMYVEEIS